MDKYNNDFESIVLAHPVGDRGLISKVKWYLYVSMGLLTLTASPIPHNYSADIHNFLHKLAGELQPLANN